ncbi:MAG: hypothetical protein ACTSRP_21900 [Candidatus Helarchaeota archaeon]
MGNKTKIEFRNNQAFCGIRIETKDKAIFIEPKSINNYIIEIYCHIISAYDTKTYKIQYDVSKYNGDKRKCIIKKD